MLNTRSDRWKKRFTATILPLLLMVALAVQFLPSGDQSSVMDTPELQMHSFGYGFSSNSGTETVCNDLIDNDADSLVDCEDNPDCSLSTHCAEICDNQIDDDQDGAVDCDDLWCKEYDPDCA